MSDTTPRAERLFRELMLRKSPEERVLMASSMFDAAREMLVAGLRTEHPGLEGKALRIAIFLRTYGQELTPKRIQQVLDRMNAQPPEKSSDD